MKKMVFAFDSLFVYGVLKIANLFVAIAAMILLFRLLALTKTGKERLPWIILSVSAISFALQELYGALKGFGIWSLHYEPLFLFEFIVAAAFTYAMILKMRGASHTK